MGSRAIGVLCIQVCCILLVGRMCATASDETVAVRVLARELPVADRRILPEDGWRVTADRNGESRRYWESRGEWVHVLSNVSQACADDIAAYVDLYTGQVMPVLQEMFDREHGSGRPIRLYAYSRKEDAPDWWTFERKGYHIWHDADQWAVHWILREGESGRRMPGVDAADVQYHLARMLLRRFISPERFVLDTFQAPPLNIHYAANPYAYAAVNPQKPSAVGGAHPMWGGGVARAQSTMEEIREFRREQTGAWLDALDEWRKQTGLADSEAMPDYEMIRQKMAALGGTGAFMPPRWSRHHPRQTDMENAILGRMKELEPGKRTPVAMMNSWNEEFTDWRKDAAGWVELAEEEQDSLFARLWGLLRFWERFLENDLHSGYAVFPRNRYRGKPAQRRASNVIRPSVSPTFEEGTATLLGKAWDPYLRPEANLAYAQLAFNPLLLVRPHHPEFDSLRPYDPYAQGESDSDPTGQDPRVPWLDSKTLIENGLFHGELVLNTKAQGFLLLSFLLNDVEGRVFLRELVLAMRNSVPFHRYGELDRAWLAYLERGVLRTAGGQGIDAGTIRAGYGTVRERDVRQVDFDGTPTWTTLSDFPLVRGIWMHGGNRVRVSQTNNRLSIFGYAENGQMAFSGRAIIGVDGMVEGDVRYHRGNRTVPVRGRLAPDGKSLHPVSVQGGEGLIRDPWTRAQ